MSIPSLSIDILKGGGDGIPLEFSFSGMVLLKTTLHIWQHSRIASEREEGTLMLVAICFAHCVAMEWDPIVLASPAPAPTLSSACLLPVKTSKNKFN